MIKLKNLRAAKANQIYYFHKGKFEGTAIIPIIKFTERMKGSQIKGLTKNAVCIQSIQLNKMVQKKKKRQVCGRVELKFKLFR